MHPYASYNQIGKKTVLNLYGNATMARTGSQGDGMIDSHQSEALLELTSYTPDLVSFHMRHTDVNATYVTWGTAMLKDGKMEAARAVTHIDQFQQGSLDERRAPPFMETTFGFDTVAGVVNLDYIIAGRDDGTVDDDKKPLIGIQVTKRFEVAANTMSIPGTLV
jgi:hypothetical protein